MSSYFGNSVAVAQVFEDQYFRQMAKRGLDYTYDLDFEKAHQVFDELNRAYPQHPAPHYLLAFNRWWQSYISTTPYYHSFIVEQLQLALDYNVLYGGKAEYRLEYT